MSQTTSDQSASGEATASRTNTVTWWELPVADLAGAQEFYGAVFGWTFQPFGEGYVGVFADGQMIGGMFEQAEVPQHGPRLYVLVDDIEATLATVERHGGTIRAARAEVGGDMGWWAELSDPAGRNLGICSGNAAAAG